MGAARNRWLQKTATFTKLPTREILTSTEPKGFDVDRRISLRLLPVLIVCGLLIAGCGDQASDQANGRTDGQADAPAPAGARIGAEVPDFRLERLDGSALQLSDLRGKAVIIDFWDTWCPPCRAAMPHLQEISETYKDDLVVVGVAFGRQGKAAVQKFVTEQGLTFEFVLADQNVVNDFGGLQSIPTTFLVDRQGKVTHKWVGGQSKAAYESAVQSVISS